MEILVNMGGESTNPDEENFRIANDDKPPHWPPTPGVSDTLKQRRRIGTMRCGAHY